MRSVWDATALYRNMFLYAAIEPIRSLRWVNADLDFERLTVTSQIRRY